MTFVFQQIIKLYPHNGQSHKVRNSSVALPNHTVPFLLNKKAQLALMISIVISKIDQLKSHHHPLRQLASERRNVD